MQNNKPLAETLKLYLSEIRTHQRLDDHDRVQINQYLSDYANAYSLFIIPEFVKKCSSDEQVNSMKIILEKLHSFIEFLIATAVQNQPAVEVEINRKTNQNE